MAHDEERAFSTAVGAVIFDRAGRVLLVRRAHPPLAGEWSLLGGRPEAGETLEEAVLREVHEESGLAVDLLGPIAIVRIAREGYAYEIHEFACAVRGDSPAATAGDDAVAVCWADPSELESLGVREEARAIVAQATNMFRPA